MITQYYKLNLKPSNVKPIVAVSQYDTTRQIVFFIYDGEDEFVPEGMSAKVMIGTEQFDGTIDGSKVSCVIDDSITQEETSKYGEVVFYGNGKVATCNFLFRVYFTPIQED